MARSSGHRQLAPCIAHAERALPTTTHARDISGSRTVLVPNKLRLGSRGLLFIPKALRDNGVDHCCATPLRALRHNAIKPWQETHTGVFENK